MLMLLPHTSCFLFFFNDTATTEIYTLSLHDALPICATAWSSERGSDSVAARKANKLSAWLVAPPVCASSHRSEEHTSELQSRLHLVCRLLLEKKKAIRQPHSIPSKRDHDPACTPSSS